MDEFESRLKDDAQQIRTGDPAALRARIDASLRGTEPIRPVPESRDSRMNLWWSSSITGLAAAIIVIVLINWNRPVEPEIPAEPVAGVTVPRYIEDLENLYPPRIRNADFTDPLEDELVKLRADLEKARKGVAKDIEFSF